jgi:hypothetical protein
VELIGLKCMQVQTRANMNPNFKPILAATLLPSDQPCNDETVMAAMKSLRYPVMATVKKDGVRALRLEDIYLASRTLKWIPNTALCARAIALPVGYDMELWSPKLTYNEIQSIVMTENADSEEIEFHVLDDFTKGGPYKTRIQSLNNDYVLKSNYTFEYPIVCWSAEGLFEFEKQCINYHSEGICFRIPDSPYNTGMADNRSTLFQQYLVKHCRWIYSDCQIIGFKEQMFNGNKVRRNALGKMDRSKSIQGMIPKDTLGAFSVKNEHGIEFDVGNGMGLDELTRQYIWLHQDKYLGKWIVVKSKAHGVKNKPRSPIFWGFKKKGM